MNNNKKLEYEKDFDKAIKDDNIIDIANLEDFIAIEKRTKWEILVKSKFIEGDIDKYSF